MALEHEYGYKTRLLKILVSLVENPFRYTKNQLADRYGVSKDTITNDFESYKNAGFRIEYDKNYRYAFGMNKPLKQLQDLLHFSEEDQILLHSAIDQIATNTKRAKSLKKKLAALYDFKKLGHTYLRKPYLTKVDLLLNAKKEKKQILLEDYSSSNSNEVKNRIIEPYAIDPPEDTVQAYDLDKNDIRHFRISRIKRIKPLEATWSNTNQHVIKRTDAFRIVNNNQVTVELNLTVGAKNELIERYPLSKAYLTDGEHENTYYLQAPVNNEFIGLSNFILGHYHQGIEVLGPKVLLKHLKMMVTKFQF